MSSSRYRQPAAAGLSGDDRALTAPAAAKALTCVRNWANSSRNVLRCQVDEDEARENREIPLWMFDAVRCARMVPTSQPQVCWAALLDLRRLLDETRPEETAATIEDRCPSTTEGTDATSPGTTRSPAASRPVRAPAPRPRWPDLPHDTRMTVTALLAQLLGGEPRHPRFRHPLRRWSMSEKLTAHHLARRAIVYVRQSSHQQLVHNRESQRRQYAMEQRSVSAIWAGTRRK